MVDLLTEPVVDPLADWKKQPYTVLAGTAGTGKSFFSREWAAQDRGVQLMATTGIAAINLGGSTINGALSFFDTASLRDAYVDGRLETRLRKLHAAGLRRIVLDEMSMLDGDQLTILTKALEDVAGRGYAFGMIDDEGEEVELPQDDQQPVSLTLVGDFAQLPPVKASFAFESPEWVKYEPHTHRLTEIRRQTDADYIAALQATRRGDAATALEYFASRMVPQSDQHFDGPTILARNEQVWRFNDLRLAALKTPEVRYRSERWTRENAKPPGEWKNIPEELVLKEQALVMILANARDPENPRKFLYVNGDLGDLVDRPNEDVCHVKLRRTGQVVAVCKVTRAVKIPLEVGRAKQLRKDGLSDRIEGKWEIVGALTYMPLRLAWASTVHKSQGLSLDLVQVNINDHFFSTPGMLYVALSRARTAEGLRLVGSPNVFKARCTTDKRISQWL